jgi:hypothetical protein
MNPKVHHMIDAVEAARTIEVSICKIADYDLKKALEGLDELVGDMRANIIKICELAK